MEGIQSYRLLNDFDALPVLDYASRATDRPAFLAQLRHTLINVGFLYLVNHSVDRFTIHDLVVHHIPALFALSDADKHNVRMANSPHFLGYSRLGAEVTKGVVDYREQFDLGTEHAARQLGPNDPDYYKLWGPNQWPEEHLLPGYRDAMNSYFDQVTQLAHDLKSLIAEALGLPPDEFDRLYDKPSLTQHNAKVSKYPAVGGQIQGVGPHYDAGFVTVLLQASPHKGLQVQNLAGEWIDAPPLPGSLVINFGKALEFVTQGVVRATSHRVLSRNTESPRYSIAFFHNISLDAQLAEHVFDFPPHVLRMRDQRGVVGPTDSVNFSELDHEPYGKVYLIARVKSHPNVSQRHYPDLFKLYFPDDHKSVDASVY
ncbi:hypothetical protein AX15_005456 [Amanita polypyramis BW_CC]|nr:hypothetical protein AX15_005456 [Amanita polypyramis BW_CC]